MEALLNPQNYPTLTTQCLHNANLCLNLSLYIALCWEFFENYGTGPVPPATSMYLLLLMFGSMLGWEGTRRKIKLYVLITTIFWIYDTYVCWKVLAHPISKDLHGKRFLKGIHFVKFCPNLCLILYGLNILVGDFDSWLEWDYVAHVEAPESSELF